jgi:hypothetical protein
MSEIHPHLKKFVFDKLVEDISDKGIFTNESDFWIIEEDTRDWFIQANSNGQLFYNQRFFQPYQSLFSLESKSLGNLIGEWFEKNFDLPLRTIQRKQGSMEYYISGFLKKKKGLLEFNNRYGFTYGFTKKYLTLKKGKGKVFVEDYLLVD